jgi:hypothetical protein
MNKNIKHKLTFDEAGQEIQEVCFDLLRAAPFYGHVMGSINRSLVEGTDQMEPAVLESLGLSTVKMTLSYELWEPLYSQEKINRMFHKEEASNIGLFYTACDLSVNMYCDDKTALRLENFEKLCRRHGVKIDTDGGYFSIYNSLIDLFRAIPGNIMKKHNMKKEDYEAEMSMHQQNALKGEFFDPGTEDLNEAIAMLPKKSTGENNISGLNSLIQALKRGGASEEDIKNAIQNFMASDQDPWKAVADGTSSTAAEDLVKRLISETKDQGIVPGGLSEYVDLLLAPAKIDWRKECRDFTSRAGHVTLKTTMTRRSKRFGTFPASKIVRNQRIAIAIDTSGSMSDDEFQQAISEVRGALTSNCQVIIVQADCQVDNVEIHNRKLPNVSRVERFGNGGTSFDDALLYVKTGGQLDKYSEFPDIGNVDGMVYITDGYAPAPKRENYPRCNVLWLTTQKTVEEMRSEGFRGKILFLDCEDM